MYDLRPCLETKTAQTSQKFSAKGCATTMCGGPNHPTPPVLYRYYVCTAVARLHFLLGFLRLLLLVAGTGISLLLGNVFSGDKAFQRLAASECPAISETLTKHCVQQMWPFDCCRHFALIGSRRGNCRLRRL